jgi:hypothetical protein
MATVRERAAALLERADAAWQRAAPVLKTCLHVGFLPAIIVAGMTLTEPRPSLAQLLGPM